MPWYLFIATSKIFDTLNTLQARSIFSSRKIRAISFTILNSLFSGTFTLIYALTQPNFGLLPGQSIPWWNLILMMILYGFGSAFYYNAFEHIEASKVAIISAAATIFSILSSVILLNDTLIPIQYLGGFIVLIGIVVTNIKKSKFQFGKGELFCLIGAACFGAETANDKLMMGSFGVNFYLVLAYFIPMVMLLLVYPKDRKELPSTLKAFGVKNILIYTVMFALQGILFFVGLNLASSTSMVIFVSLAGRVLTVVLSILILKEHTNLWQKILGTAIVVLGLYVLG